MTGYLALTGRMLLAFIFVMSGLGKVFSWSETAQYMADKGMCWVPLFLFGAILLELLGGMLVVLGYKTRVGVSLLLVFLVAATLIFHDFWTLDGPVRRLQMIMFMKNLSISGGLLMVAAFGPGPISLDERLRG